MRHRRIWTIGIVVAVLTIGWSRFSHGAQVTQRQEESYDYFDKWLNEDVVYIISDEERDVFEKLTAPEEKEQFIEQFWYRRDPDPRTPANEFKEEHYRRIAYANEKYSVGMPGWKSDRGRIYIIHGPPDQIESRPTGGRYMRPSWEGGGVTQAYPYEVWRYRRIEGLGQEIELEFVDRTMSGVYELALHPEEKDALLEMGTAGPTWAEIMGEQTKADRPYFNFGNQTSRYIRQQDSLFERYARFANIEKPAPIRYTDLQEIVNVDVSYDDLPFRTRKDTFRLSESQVLVPITVEIEDKDLSFTVENGQQTAEVAVYGAITSIRNRLVMEFEEELITSYPLNENPHTGGGRALYQKIVVLESGMRYRLDIVVKDLSSGKTGMERSVIVAPSFADNSLSLSPLILSNYIDVLPNPPLEPSMFILGDVRVYPSLSNRFRLDQSLKAYFQVYNLAIDQSSGAPDFTITYRLIRDGSTVVEMSEHTGESVQFYSDRRMVVVENLPIEGLAAGQYRLEVEVQDRISGDDIVEQADIILEPPVKELASQ
ncbi:MAG TPA: GWxTD domain-containing protein [Acidobacteriota bacterium]|nr:GWxTD domain-containing protein [Acidobacteriota bacterium]